MDNAPHAFPFTFTPRESRTYVHDKCQSSTVVSGLDFFDLVDPTARVILTRCAQCGLVSLSSVRWQDTNEPIADYRQRLGQVFFPKLPSVKKMRIIIWAVVLIVAVIALLVKFAQNKGGEGVVIFILGCVAALFIAWLVPHRIREGFFSRYLVRHKTRLTDID